MKQATKASLSLGALGVVYGDIGTSPLYALRESLGVLPLTLPVILGLLSLIFWALVLVISVKYLVLILQADNEGEGGVLALLALLKRSNTRAAFRVLFLLGIFGAGLMLGDCMLTPAISVLSAIEGLTLVSPHLNEWILPLACVLLVLLFACQSFGTTKIGFLFGPIILVWFLVLGWLGLAQVIDNPQVLLAINPHYAVYFLFHNGWHGYLVLGSIFLVVTGGEALYADLGHFGRAPIRYSWFFVALPALLLNYFGQGAYLLKHSLALTNPFYSIAPSWFTLPLLLIAMCATIIASQAVISAAFSLTKQAILLGLYPYIPIKQTSVNERGQIYVPQVNFILALGTLLLILKFKHSSALAHAYGIAVNLVMILTTMMIIYVAHKQWRWHPFKIILVFSFFIVIDLLFLGANCQKILTGGWLPITFAMLISLIMLTWHRGMHYLRSEYFIRNDEFLSAFKLLPYQDLTKLPEHTVVFITDYYDQAGKGLLQFLTLTQALPENILLVNYIIDSVPYVHNAQRFEIKAVNNHICYLTVHYGFMDDVDIPRAIANMNDMKKLPFLFNVDKLTYLVEIANVLPSHTKTVLRFYWQRQLFAYLMRNYSVNLNIEFYRLPYRRTIAIGAYYDV